MQVNYSVSAFNTLLQLVNFIEETNSQGAGIRWFNRYELFLSKSLAHPGKIKLCNNQTFYQLKLHCIYFNDWVIAFSVDKSFVLIEALLHKSRVSD
jgi:hypothetical protein